MKCHKLRLPILLVIMIQLDLFADQVKLLDETCLEGKIISADQNYIYLQLTDTTTAKIPHALVHSVFFNYSDLLYLQSGEVIECKIIDRTLTELKIVTGQGVQPIKLIDIKRYFYNTADSLLVPLLPPTGNIYNNQKIFEQQKTISGKYLLAGINSGFTGIPAEKWNDSFITTSNLLGFSAGIRADYTLRSDLLGSAGLEYTWIKNTSDELRSTVRRYFFYLGLAYMKNFSLIRSISVLAGIELGINHFQGNIYSFSYRNITIDKSGIKLGLRPYLGAQTNLTSRLVSRIQIGYLLGQPLDIQPGPEYLKKIDIGYAGPFLLFHLFYEFSISD
jgi:hypothetical protein